MTIILIIIANLWLNSSFPISLGFNQRKNNKKKQTKKNNKNKTTNTNSESVRYRVRVSIAAGRKQEHR